MIVLTPNVLAVGPTVSNVRSSQRPGTNLVDIYYDLADPDTGSLTVAIVVSSNGGASYTLPTASFTGALGAGITPGTNKKIIWNAGADWSGNFSSNVRFRVTANDDTAPTGMALIPAGTFQMGDTYNTYNERDSDELPVHSVYVSAFYMDRYEVTKALWDEVYIWATTHGYSFDYRDSGQGKAPNHPAHTMTWYDAVKWCNARSEKEGMAPAYYTDSALTTRYRSGQVAPYVNWSASGYRLPTEAEWEKAARGGASGHRFPWSDTDNITHSRANYICTSKYSYDTSPTRGCHPAFASGGSPYTSPAGYFAPNGYGLYDMAGNISEWCWDWHKRSYYGSAPSSNPRGPGSGSYRVQRGGGWLYDAGSCRAAIRIERIPTSRTDEGGFRSVRAAGQ